MEAWATHLYCRQAGPGYGAERVKAVLHLPWHHVCSPRLPPLGQTEMVTKGHWAVKPP